MTTLAEMFRRCDELDARLVRLEAELTAARAALTRIAELCTDPPRRMTLKRDGHEVSHEEHAYEKGLHKASKMAAEALAGSSAQ